MNGLNRSHTTNALGLSGIDEFRVREGMERAMTLANLTLRACGRIRAGLSAVTGKRDLAPKRVLANRGVTYFD